ncbi:retinoblastoma-binding protein 5-like protein [Sarcoptes scabiei]|uniref:Retinoblastoma-binding protein 5-like protein n=1 Tax=Sarcoptes scabiei TaxID=52283 RepID=A0A132ABV4_SARSC|nr:retinoblastoma-binding protein 5-like protein [Sarcoptes scabiei]
MNLQLLEKFGQQFPEEYDTILEGSSYAITLAFNRYGTILAAGCNDGKIQLWDFMTREVAKTITAHLGPVTSLSWSRNGKYLASSSTDWGVYVWDVLKSTAIIRWRLNSPINQCQFSPRDHTILLVHTLKKSYLVQYEFVKKENGEDETGKWVAEDKIPSDYDLDLELCSTFDRRGENIYCGTNKGKIRIFRIEKGTIKFTFLVYFRVSNSAIKQIEFSLKKKNIFLVLSADKILRIYDSNAINEKLLTAKKDDCGELFIEIDPFQRIQDLINKTVWKKCIFSSGEADFVCASSQRDHTVSLWDRLNGSFLQILFGMRGGETVADVAWHPLRSVIAILTAGCVTLFTEPQVENWSAFAPDFKELEENIDYNERESEFDEFDEDRSPPRMESDNREEEDIEVDIEKPVTNELFLSSDEEEEDQDALLYIPLTLDIEYDEPDQNVPATPKKNQNQPLPKNKKRDQNQDNAVNYDSTNTYNIVP